MKIFLLIFFCSLLPFCSIAQELEPRLYANLPKGTNALALLYGYSSGNVVTDPSLPIKDFKINAHTLGLGYAYVFGLAGKLARVQLSVPFTLMTGKLQLNGQDTTGVRNGFGDARVRFGINLIGSPALNLKEFREYQQQTIVGASIVVTVPTGLYYKEKRINIGSNRWAFKPEIGVSRRFKKVYAEAYAGVWLYTQNNEFLSVKELTQEPVLSFQTHFSYYFKNGIWVGFNANFFNGGQTVVDQQPVGDLKDNWRVGCTFSIPLKPKHSLKFQFHTGAFTKSGYDYNIAVIGYQYVFFR